MRSMTGFGRDSASGDWGSLTWEVKSVNHRYFEIYFKTPPQFREVEFSLRNVARAAINRGKLDVQLQYEPSVDASLQLDRQLVNALVKTAKALHHEHGLRMLSAADIMRHPGVVLNESIDAKALSESLKKSFSKALDALVASREEEGVKIKGILQAFIEALKTNQQDIAKLQESYIEKRQADLKQRVQEIGENIEPNRLEQELVLLAQKLDIREEVDRLQAHLETVSDALLSNEAVGRRLDFLMQELNREVNTIASKSQHAVVSQKTIEMKVIIEQMREQVQNVE